VRYAAYGSNLHPIRLIERTPSATLLGTEALPGFTLRFEKRGRDGSAKCTIAPEGDAWVHLAISEIADREKPALDRAEGLGHGYSLETIELPRFGACQTYVGQREHLDAALLPFTWYRELVLVGCEFHRFPEAYVRRVSSAPAQLDANAARHEGHMTLVRRARAQAGGGQRTPRTDESRREAIDTPDA
jgi:hypothetical protein